MYPDASYALIRLVQFQREMTNHPAEQHRRAVQRNRREVRRRRWAAVSRRVTAPAVFAFSGSRTSRNVRAA